MDTTPGSALVEGSTVFLSVGTGSETLECRVLAFLGEAVVVVPQTPPSEAASEWLATGTTEMLIEQGELFRAFTGNVSRVGSAFAIRVLGAAALGQRRWWSRVEVELDAEIVPQPAGVLPGRKSSTIDVSAGGARIHRLAGMPAWPRYSLTLSGRALGAPVTVEAVLTRASKESLGLRFTRIDADDQARLASFVLDQLSAGAG